MVGQIDYGFAQTLPEVHSPLITIMSANCFYNFEGGVGVVNPSGPTIGMHIVSTKDLNGATVILLGWSDRKSDNARRHWDLWEACNQSARGVLSSLDGIDLQGCADQNQPGFVIKGCINGGQVQAINKHFNDSWKWQRMRTLALVWMLTCTVPHELSRLLVYRYAFTNIWSTLLYWKDAAGNYLVYMSVVNSSIIS